jgi:hypothetical protein
LGDRFLHPQGRPHGSFRIIFVSNRRPEHRKDAIAQEFFYASAEPFDVLADASVIRREANPHVFGV